VPETRTEASFERIVHGSDEHQRPGRARWWRATIRVLGVNRDVASVTYQPPPNALRLPSHGQSASSRPEVDRRVCHRGRRRLADTFERTPNAIIDALAAHTTMSKQALDSERVREGLKDVLLGPAQLYEALRERAGQQLEP
jgi:hypothetical protein